MPGRLVTTIAAIAICVVILMPGTAAYATDRSVYVPMEDGVRLAADIHLPGVDEHTVDKPSVDDHGAARVAKRDVGGNASAANPATFPTLLIMTRYGRASRLSAGGIAAVNGLGFAVAVFDMRGSGASEGSRHAVFSAEERADIGRVLDWIVTQDWSNGTVVATGVSYDANLAEFAALAGHPALKAVVSRFGDYDLYRHLIAPGGIRNRMLIEAWGDMVYAADRSIGCLLDRETCAGQAHLKPVDGDGDLKLLRRALLQHQKNWNPAQATVGYEFIDDVLPSGRRLADGFLSARHRKLRESAVPLQIWGSWMDAATAETALIRYLINEQAPIEVYIGAWSHGGGLRADPFFADDERLRHDTLQPLQQFAEYLVAAKSASYPKRVIHYYTMGSGWHQTTVWPPAGTRRSRLYFGREATLVTARTAGDNGVDTYAVDFGVSTGTANRWYTQLGGGAVSYDKWSAMHPRMLAYTSEPLTSALEITGSPELGLALSSSHPDAAVHVYLSAVSPSGDVVYLTEGHRRLVNRKPAGPSAAFPAPFDETMSFRREDAAPITPGEVYDVHIRLLPTSALVPEGYRIRLSLAGHDADTFERYPAKGDVEFRMHRYGRSYLDLPHADDLVTAAAAPAYDVILRGGTVYDGSGAPPIRADLAIAGDRIAAVGDLGAASGEAEIDVSGLAVAPGFINMLSWAIEDLLKDGRALSDIKQGVTLEVFGEGWSMGPLPADPDTFIQSILGDTDINVDWRTLGEYLEKLEREGVSTNVASFVGATTLRINVLGFDNRKPDATEMERMRTLAREAMREGALGLGSSLIYPPAFYATTEELIELAEAVAEFGGIYVSHLRSEANRVLEAVDELIRIAREGGLPAHIYHLKLGGKPNWDKLPALLERIEAAQAEGMRITADMYLYTAGSTGLAATMPPWVQEGGDRQFVERLKDPETRARVVAAMQAPTDDWENMFYLAGSENIRFAAAGSEALQDIVGKSLAEVAAERSQPAAEVAVDLIVESENQVAAIYFMMSEANIEAQLGLPWISFGSDGTAVAPEGEALDSNPHPRSYGNFARLLGRYVRDRQVLSLTDAIRRLTSFPAEILGIRDRGVLQPGYFADIAVFDPDLIADKATFEKPHQLAVGMRHVFVNGEQVLKDGVHTNRFPGRVVRGPGWTGARPER